MDEAEALKITLAELHEAVALMARAVPRPKMVKTASGAHYRYVEQLVQQALVLKCVRAMSALTALQTLIGAGLALDAGASMRILDEIGSDVMFLAAPLVLPVEPEERHKRYLSEFFQEEFDSENPLKATQKRHRVSRSDIRAYVARTYRVDMPVSDVVRVTETIENAFSGYIHGAAAHTIDVYDGNRFCVPLKVGDGPLEAVREQIITYAFRALVSAELVSKALRQYAMARHLRNVRIEIYDDYGAVRRG
ncbi:hypothetical protein [Mesorhizobium sp. M0674]|uniref:hypothetical protein n=1 Tax=unclassified Mesorhizobium TaxID=325217 RepID=UPI003337B267